MIAIIIAWVIVIVTFADVAASISWMRKQSTRDRLLLLAVPAISVIVLATAYLAYVVAG